MLETHCPVLAALRSSDRDSLLTRGVQRSLQPGEPLFFSGERSGRVHLVTDGALKLVLCDADGNESILGLAIPGDLVGEIAALDGDGQPFDAIAATRVAVIGVDADVLVRMVGSTPAAAVEMMRSLARRNRWMCTTAFERTSSEVPARLAGRLLDLADRLGRPNGNTIELELPLAQGDLGRLAGMCRESACKALTHFRRGGVVDYRGRKLRILRPDVLEGIRCAGRAAKPSR